MATNRIIPLAREVEVGKRITGNADARPRPKVETAVQVDRLGGAMETSFRNILDRDDIKVADDPSALAPERALVVEIIGTPTSFVAAAEKAGLEWLAEEAATLYGVDEYLEPAPAETDEFDDVLGGDVEQEGPGTVGRLNLGMPTLESFARLRDYWTAYAAGEAAPYGMGVWWDLFSHLHRIRPWSAEDRVGEATRMRLRAERSRHPDIGSGYLIRRIKLTPVPLRRHGGARRQNAYVLATHVTPALARRANYVSMSGNSVLTRSAISTCMVVNLPTPSSSRSGREAQTTP